MSNKRRCARPCNGRSISACMIVFMSSFFSLGIALSTDVRNIRYSLVVISFIFMICNVYLLIFCLFKFNSPILVDNEHISQKQFGVMKIFKYYEIDNVKLTNSYCLKVPPIITIYKKEEKISFEVTSGILDEILLYCSEKDILEKIKKIKDKTL